MAVDATSAVVQTCLCPQARTCRLVTPSPHMEGRWRRGRRGRSHPGPVPQSSCPVRPKLWTCCSSTPANTRANPRPSKTTSPSMTGRESETGTESGRGRATGHAPRRPNAFCLPIITWGTSCCRDSTTCPTPQVRRAHSFYSLPVSRVGGNNNGRKLAIWFKLHKPMILQFPSCNLLVSLHSAVLPL